MGAIVGSGIIGFIEAADDHQVVGWAFNPTSMEALQLQLFIDGKKVEAISCNRPRPDVLSVGYGRENVGFQVQIPPAYCDGLLHFVEIRGPANIPIVFRNDSGRELKEWVITAYPEYSVGTVDTWDGRDLHCWAVLVDRVTGRARPAEFVSIRQDGRDIATLLPTISRPDVADRFCCGLNCGFMLPARNIRQLNLKLPLHIFITPYGEEINGSPVDISSVRFGPTEMPPASQGYPSGPVLTASPHLPIVKYNTSGMSDPRELLKNSGLFDEAFYLQAYPDLASADMPLLEHFFDYGYREGRRPNPYFEPQWYLEQYPEVAKEGAQPLLHFVCEGDRLGHNPGPLFQTTWYRERYLIAPEDNTLAHYLRFRFEQPLSPLPDFDAEYYAEKNPDVFEAGVDMFDHFFSHGYRECRNPSADFDVKYYVQRYLNGDFSINPLVHFWAHRHEPGVHGRPPDDEVTVAREVRRFCRPGPYFEDLQQSGPHPKPKVMLLAYYLPQFHAFPENDVWWGKGFTEWTNLVRGSPRFIGHYQPRVPRDLGFYTLDSNQPMRRQIELAQAGGVCGFVFYYYWFNGKRLMDQPVRRFLQDPTLDIRFALMWANENWTRRWDGAESEVLISQDYRMGDDDEMAAQFVEHFKDSRYIRLHGRPLLMIYRAGIIPDTQLAITRWRKIFQEKFAEDPIFVMAQAFNAEDPREFGFDGAIEFPPHKLTTNLAPVNAQFTYLDMDFNGQIHRYDDVAAISLREPFPDFPLIKTAVPSWDNDARREGTGLVITGSTPSKYEAWLAALVDIAREHKFFGEAIVCVNAWNEWCEGAYLEPDLHFGGAYLNATARAVAGRARSAPVPRVVLVGHDAFAGGSQHLLLNIGRALRREFGIEFEYLLLGDGDMTGAYAEQGPLTVIASDTHLSRKLQALAESGFAGAIVNTCAAARAVAFLRAANIHPVLLVHELPRILREKHLTEHARLGLRDAAEVVFSAAFVRDAVLTELAAQQDERMHVLPQGSYRNVRFDAACAMEARRDLGLGEHDALVLGVGYADLRKGFDLFMQVWRHLHAASATIPLCVVWAGGIDPTFADWMAREIAVAEATGTFKMAGYRNDMPALFSAASVFALTSREDPLPTVVMEALGAGCPVVAFDGTGGAPDMLRGLQEGVIIPYGDAAAMARAILMQIEVGISGGERDIRHHKIAGAYHFPTYVRRLMKLALPGLAEVSVAVPNYNYAKYMPARLDSIFQQTYPVHEVLVLDDCSRDDSLRVIEDAAHDAQRVIRLVVNETNSGSVFVQWRRAAELATGEFLWIAEADDLSDPDFLARTTALLASDRHVQFAFSDSRTIDAESNAQWETYKSYYATVEPGALTATAIYDASEFVRRFLSVKNLILNVSAVVWRRDGLLQALKTCPDEVLGFTMAGDWLLYLTALSAPGALVGYESRPLNVHRRHATSVTHAINAEQHVAEIVRCHKVAAGRFALPAASLLRQQEYQAEIAAQLASDCII